MRVVQLGLSARGPRAVGHIAGIGGGAVARILVIDDQPEIREVLKTILEEEGHKVCLAANGVEGLRRFAESPAEIVLSDLHMPGMNGLETIHALREQSCSTKIIAMSGADTYMVEKNLESSVISGADLTLLKPFQIHEVLNAVQAVAR